MRQALAAPVGESPLPKGFTDAAVLLPIWQEQLLLTVRAAHLPHHAAQISFPGGRLDPGETFLQAALREAWEEVGLPSEQLEVLGQLQQTYSPFGFRVTPFVAWLEQAPQLKPNPNEVGEVLWVPIADLQEAPAYAEERLGPDGLRRRIWHYPWRGYNIWGLTGGIVHDFLERLSEVPSVP